MISPGTRIEVGVVGVPPRPEQLRPPPLPETVVMNFGKLCNLWCAHCFFPGVTLAREAREADGAPEPCSNCRTRRCARSLTRWPPGRRPPCCGWPRMASRW